MKNKLAYILLALFSLSFLACTSDEKEFFSQPASQRLAAILQEDKALLEAAENGWELHYYAGEDYRYGGSTFFIKFKDGKATVSADFVPSDSVTTSEYRLTENEGATLTFPTYNAIMHEKALSYPRNVNGEEGDYEFAIIHASKDSVVLKGKKWHNRMVMKPIPAGVSWVSRMDSISNLKLDMPSRFNLSLGEDSEIGSAIISVNNGRASFIVEGQNVSMPFVFTTKGIELQTPIRLRGQEYRTFTWSDTSLSLKNGELTLVSSLPENYKPRSFWVGRWRINQGGNQNIFLNVTLNSAKQLEAVFEIGTDRLPLTNAYNSELGCLSFTVQASIPEVLNDRSAVYLVGLTNSSRFDTTEGAGFNLIWDEASQSAKAVDNGIGNTPHDGFIGIDFGTNNNPIQVNNRYRYSLVILNFESLTRVNQ